MGINDKAEDYINMEEDIEFEKPINGNDEEQVNEQPKSNKILDMLKSKTGEGSLDQYTDHPLNFKNNHYLSQILRGLTGMIGSLDFALIDIIVGTIGFFKGDKGIEDV